MLKTNPEDIDFHINRRMFVISDDEVIYAPIGSPLSHSEWFLEEGWTTKEDLPNFLDKHVRGFYDVVSDILYFYTGNGFYFDNKVHYTTLLHLQRFLINPTLDTSRKTMVVLGPRDEIIKGVRHSKLCLGTMGGLMRYGAFSL